MHRLLKLGTVYKVLGKKISFLFLFSFVASLSLVGVEVLIALTLKAIVGYLQDPNSLQNFFDFQISSADCVYLFIALSIARSSLIYFSSWIPTISEVLFKFRMRGLLFLTSLRGRSISNFNQVEFQYQLNDNVERCSQFLQNLSNAFSTGVVLFTMIGVMMSVAPTRTFAALMGFAVVGLIIYLLNKVLIQFSKKEEAPLMRFNQVLARVLRNWFLVKVLRTEEKETGELLGLSIYSSSKRIASSGLAIFSGVLPTVLGSLVLATLLWNQFKSATGGTTFLIFIYLLMRVIQKISEFSFNLSTLARFFENFKSITKLFDSTHPNHFSEMDRYASFISYTGNSREPRRRIEKHPDRKVDTSTTNEKSIISKGILGTKIEFINVSFSYPSGFEVFRDINLHIKAGEQIGIIGASGNGKSTLLGLIMGVLKPTSGQVLINDIDAHIALHQRCVNIGYAGPDPFLFRGTIQENLDYGARRQFSIGDYQKAIAFAGASDFVDPSNEGLLRQLEDGGEGLSAGQKQRISLARAVLDQPQLLVLDEASANLDLKSEEIITNNLKQIKERCTCLIVSHRSSILAHADRIIDLKDFNKDSKIAA